MRKRILYLFFILSTLSGFISFYSCKHNSSSPSMTIEKKGDLCYFLYKSDSNFCFSKCDTCNFNSDDIKNFNSGTSDDIIKELNKSCPLSYDTTSYLNKDDEQNIKKSFNWLEDCIGSNTELSQIGIQDEELSSSCINIAQQGFTTDDKVIDKCSRKDLISGTILTVLDPEQKTLNYLNSNYIVGECPAAKVLAHKTNSIGVDIGSNNTVDYAYKTKENAKISFSEIENDPNILQRFKLPGKEKCNKQLFQELVFYAKVFGTDTQNLPIDMIETVLFNSNKDGKARVWLDEKAKEDCAKVEQPTCMLSIEFKNEKIHITGAEVSCVHKTKGQAYLYLELSENNYNSCNFKSYIDYIKN